jgi:hypothetical protein
MPKGQKINKPKERDKERDRTRESEREREREPYPETGEEFDGCFLNGLGDMRFDLLPGDRAAPSRCLLWDRFRVGRSILDGVRSSGRESRESVESEEWWRGLMRVEGRSVVTRSV